MIQHPDPCCGADPLRTDLADGAVELTVTGFASIWRGQPITAGALLPGRAEVATEVLRIYVAEGRAECDVAGRLVGIHGLTLRATRHCFEHAGRSHHTWCAFDSIGIPAALGADSVARSTCRTCRRVLSVDIRGGTPEQSDLVLWLPTAPASHLINEFCADADLYCSRQHLEQRIDVAAVAGAVSTLDAAAERGHHVWADVRMLDLT